MNRDRSENPRLSDRGRARDDEKRQRLAAALRDNLRKRKAQARDRAAGENAAAPAKSPGAKP